MPLSPTGAPAEPGGELPGLDLAALGPWLAAQGLPSGPLSAQLATGGRSNLTYFVTSGERTWVLRRPPQAQVLTTAHDMAREHQVLSALTGTAVPVPRPVALCRDPSVLGAPFYLMERVDGVVLRTRAELARLDKEERHRVGLAMMDVLADLHALDPATVGLDRLGRPDGFLARQVRRWGQQLDRSRSRPIPDIDVLRVRLAASVPPPARSAIVHGDYRLDNLVVDVETARVVAVLDWEMSTLGDPLADLGLLLAYRQAMGTARSPLAEAAAPPPGFPSAEELVAAYARRAGLREQDLAGLPWATAFGFFKIAVILEGVHHRWSKGQTVGEGGGRVGELVPGMVRAGLAALEER